MTAYLPTASSVVAVLVAAACVVIAGGYVLVGRSSPTVARTVSWSTLVCGTFAVERVVTREPPGVRMLALITFALLCLKVIVLVEERIRGLAAPSFPRWLGFTGAWLGMQPRLFATANAAPLAGAGPLLRRGARQVALGAALVLLARLAWAATGSRLAASVLLLPGISFLLHFGLCNVLAGTWQLRGVACDALFRAPLRSQSLAEFWSRRWNLAFSEMTATAVYRPLVVRFGRGPALMAGFALSGLLHEMAISVPVRAGFGLPLLYFLVHGALVLLERALMASGRPLAGLAGRVWTIFWVVAPLPLLFHRPFLAGVIWPLVGIPPSG